jgi:hypothetical protein
MNDATQTPSAADQRAFYVTFQAGWFDSVPKPGGLGKCHMVNERCSELLTQAVLPTSQPELLCVGVGEVASEGNLYGQRQAQSPVHDYLH